MSRLFVPLDVEFASDPKILEAGHTAAYLYIVALAHCKRTMSNGDVHRAQLRMLAAGLPGSAAKHAQRLVDASLWLPIENGWHVVAWEKHNASREEIEVKRAMAAEDGERGAHARWHVAPDGNPSAKCRICVTQRLVDSRPPTEPHREPHSPPQWGPIAKEEVEPEVEPEVEKYSSSRDAFNKADPPPVENIRIRRALDHIIEQRINGSAKGDKPAYRRAVEANVRADHLAELERLASAYPTAPADVLAASAEGDTHSLRHYDEGTAT